MIRAVGVTHIWTAGAPASDAVVELRQAWPQYIRQRLLHACTHALEVVGTAAVGGALGVPDPAWHFAVGVALVFPLAVAAWLFVFNRGPGSLPSQVVELSATGIRVHRYGDVTELAWENFAGVRVSGVLSRRIRVRARRGRGLVLDYHSLSAEQRTWLLAALRAREAQAAIQAPDAAG